MASIIKVNTIQDATNSNTALSVDSSGMVQLPQLVHFHGNRVGLSDEERSGVVNYNVVRDSHSGWNSSNHQYTIPVAGVYHVGFNNLGHTGVDTSDQNHKLQFVRGGSTTDIAWCYQSNDATYEQVSLAITYYFQVSDLVQMNNVSGAVRANYYNTFSICLMG